MLFTLHAPHKLQDDNIDEGAVIDGTASITSYTIIVCSNYDSNGSCGSVDIPASSCVGRSCIYVLDSLNKTYLSNSTQIILTAFATNLFGHGLPSSPMFVGVYLNHVCETVTV